MDLKEINDSMTVRHPWEMSRLMFFKSRLLRYLPVYQKRLEVMDVGAGDGFVAGNLCQGIDSYQLVCWDIAYESDFLSKNKTQSSIRFTNERPKQKFGLIFLLDVLEHVEDDKGFLHKLVSENADTQSMFVVSVPAINVLFSAHDKKLGHYRRYSPAQLKLLLSAEGLEVIARGGLFYSLILPRIITKAKEVLLRMIRTKEPLMGRLPDLGSWRHGKILTGMIYAALRFDNWISTILCSFGISLPGLSIWAVCKKN